LVPPGDRILARRFVVNSDNRTLVGFVESDLQQSIADVECIRVLTIPGPARVGGLLVTLSAGDAGEVEALGYDCAVAENWLDDCGDWWEREQSGRYHATSSMAAVDGRHCRQSAAANGTLVAPCGKRRHYFGSEE